MQTQPEINIYIDPEVYPYEQMYFDPKVLDPQNAGLDLRVCQLFEGHFKEGKTVEAKGNVYIIRPWQFYTFDTGIRMEIPYGYWGDVRVRSSAGFKGFIFSPPVIDCNYRGNIRLAFYHPTGTEIPTFHRLMQIVISPYIKENIGFVWDPEGLSETERGKKGFGEFTS